MKSSKIHHQDLDKDRMAPDQQSRRQNRRLNLLIGPTWVQIKGDAE
jgi:hypothetical protein